MRGRIAARLGWALCALAVAASFGGLLFAALNGGVGGLMRNPTLFADVILATSLTIVGALVTARRPGNRIAWAFYFVGVGLGSTNRLGVPGDEFAVEALAWIERLKSDPGSMPRLTGRRAVIVGGGNTAIDAVTQARRLGAESTLVYRRAERQMSAYRYEIELARSMGCALLFEY